MKMSHLNASLLLLGASAITALAQPTTIHANTADLGRIAKPSVKIFGGSGAGIIGTPKLTGPPFSGYFYQTPASLACIYGLQPAVPGCNPFVAQLNPGGGANAIAIVDAYDDPNAFLDLQTFSTQFGVIPVTASSFQTVFAPHGGSTPGSCSGTGTRPPSAANNNNWDIEISLDVQMAHAMAPLAKIYLVEAQSSSFADLLCAVTVGSNLVAAAGGGQVSMSWGASEFPSETIIDPVFTTPGVVYFASSGDSAGVIYPSASPNVVSVGGTSLSTNPSTGNFISENTWQDSGSGVSFYEPRPAFQDGIAQLVGARRGTPDVAAVANPSTGVWVRNTLPANGGWYVLGGTSVSAPVWAGIVNAKGGFASSSQAELSVLYAKNYDGFTDIKSGNCGPYVGYFADQGWDLCTGLGSPKNSSQSSAAFLGTDTTTGGAWKGKYGANGYLIANDGSKTPTFATANVTNDFPYTWAAQTSDPRALQSGSGSQGIASAYTNYQSKSLNINVNILDRSARVIALYLLDWDTSSRTQTVTITDLNTNTVLDTRIFSNFHNGQYASWNIKGNVVITVTPSGFNSPVVSGIFFN